MIKFNFKHLFWYHCGNWNVVKPNKRVVGIHIKYALQIWNSWLDAESINILHYRYHWPIHSWMSWAPVLYRTLFQYCEDCFSLLSVLNSSHYPVIYLMRRSTTVLYLKTNISLTVKHCRCARTIIKFVRVLDLFLISEQPFENSSIVLFLVVLTNLMVIAISNCFWTFSIV